MLIIEADIWLKRNNTSSIIGPSLRRGASVAGSVDFHPFESVCEIR